MRLLRFALPAVLALSIVAGGAAAADRDAFRDCVARNTVKYSEPGSSAVAQYVDVEAACRAALDDGPETGFVIVDADGDRVGGDTGGTPQADPGEGTSTPSSPAQEPEDTSGSGPATGGGGGTTTSGGSGGGGTGGTADAGSAAAEPGTGPAPAVASLPASAESVEPLSGTPGWLLALVALGIVAVVATAGLETYRRRRG